MRKLLLIVLLLTLGLFVGCNKVSEKSFDYDNIAPHPRILLSQGDEERIKELIETNEILSKTDNEIMNFCNSLLSEPPVIREKIGMRLLAVSREAFKRIFFLSYAYRIHEDEKYAERAAKEMKAVCEFSDWNPSHFLDVGEMVMALGVGYDWLYDYLSDDQKKQISDAIMEKGFITARDIDARFYRDENNWNSVCNAGFLFGALAIFDEEREEAEYVIEKCVESNTKALDCFGPDGGYPEGYNYWGYGASFQALLFAAYDSAFGTDRGISNAKGFLESARFMQYMTAPSGGVFSFSDTGNKAKSFPAMFWFASKSKDMSLLWLEKQMLLSDDFVFAEDRLLPSLLVFASKVDFDKIVEPTSKTWFNEGMTPVYIYRGGWNSKNDTYLATKGGSGRTSHAHLDLGSFIYEKNGVRWSVDLGAEGYNNIEKRGINLWGTDQDSDRWSIFRLSNSSHSTLTVNEGLQLVDAKAEIINTFNSKDKKGATVDLAGIYSYALKDVKRTLWLDGNDDLTVEDIIVGGDGQSEVKWIMCTPAEAKIVSKNSIELTKDGENMVLTVESPAQVEMKIWSNKPANSYENQNEGTLRVGFVANIAAGEDAKLIVTLKSK